MNKTEEENASPSNTAQDYLGRLKQSKGTNRDGDGLGPMPSGPFVVGSVPGISGEDGKEVTEFVPTIHELKQLAEYWMQERIDRDFYFFACQCSGSSDWRWSVFISRRLERLANILGEDRMREITEIADASFRKDHPQITDEDWRVFTQGTEEEQEAWRTQVEAEMSAEERASGSEK